MPTVGSLVTSHSNGEAGRFSYADLTTVGGYASKRLEAASSGCEKVTRSFASLNTI